MYLMYLIWQLMWDTVLYEAPWCDHLYSFVPLLVAVVMALVLVFWLEV